MKERIKLLRKTLGLTLEKFGLSIGLKKNSLSQIENGINNVTDQTINNICKTNWNGKMVNEEWLRTGNGTMFIELSDNATYHEAAAQLSNDKFVVATLTEYYKRDDAFRKSLVEFISDIAKYLEKHED